MAINFENNASNRFISIVTLLGLLFFLPILLYGSYQTAILISKAAGNPAVIVVNAKQELELINTSFYHAFSQGGEAPEDMIKPVVDEISKLHPKIIRIDHIYDYFNVVSKNGNDLSFDFSRLDQSVDTIIQTGATPLLSLSYMPPVIAKDSSLINVPNNWDDWSEVVKNTIEHYSGQKNKNLKNVYYEVWNEPDLDQFGKWSIKNNDKSYLDLYEYASRGAKNAQNTQQFYLGGPGTTGLYKQWIIELINLANRGSRLDFLSWHSYLDDPNRFEKDQKNIIDWLMPYPQYVLMPKLITEFGFSGNKDARYGTNFASAFTAAVVRKLISGGPLYIFSFQPVDGPGQEKGDGWGLITHQTNGKRFKPRYHIYRFLDEMAGKRLELIGEGSWVTGYASKNEQTIRVLLVNYDIRGNHTETVPVTITNLDNGTYEIRERLFLQKDIINKISIDNGTFSTSIHLPAESIIILELKKQ